MNAESPFKRPTSLARPARLLLDALDVKGLSRGNLEDVCAALAAAGKPSTEVAARAMLAAAANSGVLVVEGDYFRPVGEDSGVDEGEPALTAEDLGADRVEHPLRVVAFDVESAVRARVEDGGQISRDVWEIGAVRFGPDAAWVAERPSMHRYVQMREGFEVHGPRTVAHAEQAVTPEKAWTEFVRFIADADMIVAYNGTGLDFGLLKAALEMTGLDEPACDLVDGLYLAHCLWPETSSYRLSDMCITAEVSMVGVAHHAEADADNLARLMHAGAQAWLTRTEDVRSLVGSFTHRSAAWRLLRALCSDPQERSEHSPAMVMATLTQQLAGRAKRRGRAPVPLAVPTTVRAKSGTGPVSPAELARKLHGAHVEVRPSQLQVTDALLRAADTKRPVMIEAPTGTGKSLSALAAALEWVDRAPQNKAVIATHTKQLQNQLAREIEQLGTQVPGLINTTDLVKGSSNRLSLRGLVYTLADATGGEVGAAKHLVRHSSDAVFCELLAFILLRVIAPVDAPSYRWAASSVDKADLPAFLLDYCGSQVGTWLGTLSQATHGEYADPSAVPVAAWTDEVREALAGHRLIIANHALLLTHWEELSADAGDMLLLVDEAHALEGAATEALSPELATADVDDLLGALDTLARDLSGKERAGELNRQLIELGMWWRDNRLRTHVSHTLDRTVGAVGLGSRALTLASPFSTEHPARDARIVARLLAQLHGLSGRVLGALVQVREANVGTLDPFDDQRLIAAHVRVGALAGTCGAIRDTLDTLLNPSPSLPAVVTAAQNADSDSDVGEGVESENAELDLELGVAGAAVEVEAVDWDEEADALERLDPEADDYPGKSHTDGDNDGDENAADSGDVSATAGAPAAVGPPPDRVVYLREDGPIGTRGLARYRFSIVSSPVQLRNDPDWQALLSSFIRVGLMSATLQVATPGKDSWAYTRTRLGLDNAQAEVVTGPFNYAKQARLVAFDDFPSWAEQPKQAMRSVAHQLLGWANNVVHRANDESSGPWHGGAMVLTTSRNAASGIAHELREQLAARGLHISVHDQPYLGTARSVAEFTGDAEHHGGFLVGTRGLWAGVDVSEAARMHLVWINKLPFPVFTDPVIAARREQVRRQAEADGAPDPDLVANSEYYLPLAALDLRQAVGRLIRNSSSRGVIVISDRKLGGDLPLRRLYRQVFLGSLDAGLHVKDPDTGEAVGGNVVSMNEGWERIWRFLDAEGLLRADVDALCDQEALEHHTVLPSTLAIRKLALTDREVEALRADEQLEAEVLKRAQRVASLLAGKEVELREQQKTAIAATARGKDVLALLPTGYGKSFCFQLPALVLPGLTIVVSPLVSLMHNQAVNLNGTIGGAVRALVGSLPESSSRAGRTQVINQMTGVHDHKIRIVYVSPERLSQARFRQALEIGVSNGSIRRVAIDEAHTYVQWGEDFRPSFRRAGALLRRVRAKYPDALTLMTLTATATPTVEDSLREEVLAGLVPAADSHSNNLGGSKRPLEVVQVNPIRPELQLARRTLRSRSQHGMSALAEQVVDAADGHIILYCLTVREVDRLHAHLRDYLDGRPVLLRKFHGRMSEIEKASMSNEFVEAARVGEEGYAQMVIVATSAFGLGIDRDDIRTVFCVSPATDLAALYQQLGRGGRDVAGNELSTITAPTYALALATSKTLDTAEWLASMDLPVALLERFGRLVLAAAPRGVIDVGGTVDLLLEHDVAAGLISEAEARDSRLREAWRTGVVRAVTALADLGAIVDHGDLPERVQLTEGIRAPGEALHIAVRDVVLELPTRGARVCSSSLRLVDLHALLRADVRSAELYPVEVEHPAELWQLLCDLHDAAVLDVSQRPNQRMLTGLGLPALAVPAGMTENSTAELPVGFAARVSGKMARAVTEAAHLRAFFAPGTRCLNERLASYFRVHVPADCCSSELNVCSVCRIGPHGPGPADGGPVKALQSTRLRPASYDPAVRAARVDNTVVALLRGVFNGVSALQIRHVLRGETKVWVPSRNRYAQLPYKLREAPQRGHLPDVTDREVRDSLDRLTASGRVVLDGLVWRTVTNAAAGPRRLRPRLGPRPSTDSAVLATAGPAGGSGGHGSTLGTR